MSFVEFKYQLTRVEATLRDVSFMLDTVTSHRGNNCNNPTEFRMFCIRGSGQSGHGYVTIEPSHDLTTRIVKEEHLRLTKLRDGLKDIIAAGEQAVIEAQSYQTLIPEPAA